MTKRQVALLAATAVAIIYGLTFSIAKDVMPLTVKPFGFIVLRVAGSTLLFWLFSPWVAPSPLLRSDIPKIIVLSVFGIALNMLTFFKGLSYTTPIMAAVLMVTTPLMVFALSAVLQKERLKLRKLLGILMGLCGTCLLILYGKEAGGGPLAGLGNLLVFVNALSYAFYLIKVKELMTRYHPFHLIKWIYTFGLIMVLPFGWLDLQEVAWATIDFSIGWKIGFVVVCSTFLTYLLNLYSMRVLKPATVAVFIYLQPVFATSIAIAQGKDQLNALKIGATLFIFASVYLVTMSRKSKAESLKPKV
ncbi:MAG: EamA family transporter [Flavobacterium sp. BFFFF2]|nr:MAG: EamA family transporter [Flavobacterium sp. BFFFF2]